jgi:hypothetical protein
VDLLFVGCEETEKKCKKKRLFWLKNAFFFGIIQMQGSGVRRSYDPVREAGGHGNCCRFLK